MKLSLFKNETLPLNSNYFISVPSFGNTGQLAADTVISTLWGNCPIRKIGIIQSEFVVPIVGYDRLVEGSQPQLCHAIEVYLIKENIIWILIRSMVVDGQELIFAKDMIQFFREYSYHSVTILSGASTDEWDVASYNKINPIFYLQSSTCHVLETIYPKVQLKELVSISMNQFNQYEIFFGKSFPDGMNLALLLLDISQQDKLTNITVLGKFCNPGNIMIDGLNFGQYLLNHCFDCEKEIHSLKYPESWKYAWGNELDRNTTLF